MTTAALPPLAFHRFAGVRIDAISWPELFARIDAWITDKAAPSHHVGCLNAYCVSLAIDDARLAQVYERADVAGPDGMPFARWLQLFVAPSCVRFYGPDVILEVAARARDTGYTFYLYGGSAESNAGMRARLEGQFPYLRVVGAHAPPFRPLTDDEDRAVCDEINRLRPDIVLVGLGTPKQDFWIADHLEKIRGAVFFGVGAAFDFFGGRVKMAPRFVQRSGFEWLYRLAGPDFRRLWRRYTVHNAHFLWHFGLDLLGRGPRERRGE